MKAKTPLPDFEAKNPRYAGKKGSDMVRTLLRPKDPKVREAVAKLQIREVEGDS